MWLTRLLNWWRMSRKDRTEQQQSREQHREERNEEVSLELIAIELVNIRQLLQRFLFPPALGFKISQINGGSMQSDIKGIVKGAVGVFAGVTDPPGSALQTGDIPVWTADDPNVTLTPSADGSSVSAATSATDTATSFNLTESGVNSAGGKISTTVNVPLTGAAPVPATGFNIKQVS